MGADTSATQLIFFISSVIIALGVVGALFMNVQSITNSATIGSKTLSEQLKTDITVINDPETIPNSGGVYTFYIKNTGMEQLGTAYVTVIIDGIIIPDENLNKTIIGSSSQTWLTGDVLQINATVSLSSGSHNLRIITTNGIEDSFSFRI